MRVQNMLSPCTRCLSTKLTSYILNTGDVCWKLWFAVGSGLGSGSTRHFTNEPFSLSRQAFPSLLIRSRQILHPKPVKQGKLGKSLWVVTTRNEFLVARQHRSHFLGPIIAFVNRSRAGCCVCVIRRHLTVLWVPVF